MHTSTIFTPSQGNSIAETTIKKPGSINCSYTLINKSFPPIIVNDVTIPIIHCTKFLEYVRLLREYYYDEVRRSELNTLAFACLRVIDPKLLP